MNKHRLFVVLMLIGISWSVVGLSSSNGKGEFNVPEDSRDTWRVGFSSLKGKGLSSDDIYLTYGIPLLLRESLEGIETHTFTNDNLRNYRFYVLRCSIEDVVSKLDSLRKKRDKVFLSGLRDEVRNDRLKKIDSNLKRLRSRLNFLRGLDPDSIKVEETKKVEIVSGKSSGGLLECPEYSVVELTRRYNLDLLVWGEIERIGDVFLLKIEAYDTSLGGNVFSYIDAGERESIYENFSEAVNELAYLFMGKPWGNLSVEVTPADSSVYINGEFIGNGKQVVNFLPVGRVDVAVNHDGYYEKKLPVELKTGETVSLNVTLKTKSKRRIKVESYPSNATLYLNSVWVGKTPVFIDLPEVVSRVEVVLSGYENCNFTISPSFDKNKIVVKLRKAIIREELRKKRRDAFYNALGLWFLSLPIPVFAFGYALDFKVGEIISVTGADIEASERLALYSDIMYYTYLGGIFVNVGLAVNMAIKIFDYLSVVRD